MSWPENMTCIINFCFSYSLFNHKVKLLSSRITFLRTWAKSCQCPAWNSVQAVRQRQWWGQRVILCVWSKSRHSVLYQWWERLNVPKSVITYIVLLRAQTQIYSIVNYVKQEKPSKLLHCCLKPPTKQLSVSYLKDIMV